MGRRLWVLVSVLLALEFALVGSLNFNFDEKKLPLFPFSPYNNYFYRNYLYLAVVCAVFVLTRFIIHASTYIICRVLLNEIDNRLNYLVELVSAFEVELHLIISELELEREIQVNDELLGGFYARHPVFLWQSV